MLVRILKRTFGGVEYGPEQKVLKLGGRGSAMVQRLEFSLPEDWDGMEVTLHVEREDGSVPEPALLDRENGVKVDGRFTACRSGLWMLMAVDGQGYRAMTKPEKYICHETLQMGEALEGMPAPLLPLYYQYAQRTMEDALAAQQAAQQAARAAESLCPDRVQLMRMLEGMSYAAPDMAAVHAELRQSWMDKIPDQPDTVPVERIRLDRVVLQMKAGESAVLMARIWPENATDKTVHWMVQPEGVAEVQDGKVTAVQKGTALITARAGARYAACAVQVTTAAVPLRKLLVQPESMELKIGQSKALEVSFWPEDTTERNVQWSAAPEGVVQVQDGTVTALADGDAVVTATVGTHSASCRVAAGNRIVPVESVRLSRGSLVLKVEDTASLTATVLPENATDKTVYWAVSVPGIVQLVDGEVTAVAVGSTNILATAGEQQALCVVQVKKKDVYYSVAQALTNVTSGNTAPTVLEGAAFETVLTVRENYEMRTVTVKMGGKDLTETAYDPGTGRVHLDAVTGDVKITATAEQALLGNAKVGSVVTIRENGALTEYLVAAHDYESSLNGEGRTLLVRQEFADARRWNDKDVNAYAESEIDRWLTGAFMTRFSEEMLEAMSVTKIRYVPGNGTTEAGVLTRKIFLLSAAELGIRDATSDPAGQVLEGADALKTFADTEKAFWTRTPVVDASNDGLPESENLTRATVCGSGGRSQNVKCSATTCKYTTTTMTLYSRPAFTLPGSMLRAVANGEITKG